MGLEIINSIEYSSGHYEFNTRVIWKHKETGKLYTARDSGCSCPVPFDGYNTIEKLEEYSRDYIRKEAIEMSGNGYYGGDPITDFIETIP